MAAIDSTPATVEINDAIFCTHLKEQCTDCDFDGREENDSFYGYDSIDRAPIECPASTTNKDGVYQCKKHGSAGLYHPVTAICTRLTRGCAGCNQCYGWKKQISRAIVAAKKNRGKN
ncbi:hypothetical protein FA13DRAFT_1753831 [Coprinellus micaceus]|uniref:Uncharacterized protein n=1 Tax=Coprinellus micaceus TaxID=71717 RepID=A0A4Y7TJD3_COPMI|nr:hypothetical protein FA13DRAFT_1753831 [Coprinellus micaceus]